MHACTTLAFLALTSTASSLAVAQTPAGATSPEAPKANANATAPQKQIRRDPAGKTGISPTWEAIKRGDDAYVAHNVDGAIKEYQAAIEAKPQNPVAHYRLACALVAKGEFKQAQESLDSALRFAQADPQTAAKVLFVAADLKEREHDYPAALTAWKAYSAFVKANPNVKAFPASAESREAKVAAIIKLDEQSAKVKQRIDERLQLMDADSQKDSKKK